MGIAIATYLSYSYEAHLVMRHTVSLLGAEFLPVELQAHAPIITREHGSYIAIK